MTQNVQEEGKQEAADIAKAEHDVDAITTTVKTEQKAEKTWSDQETTAADDLRRTVALA